MYFIVVLYLKVIKAEGSEPILFQCTTNFDFKSQILHENFKIYFDKAKSVNIYLL